MSSRVNLSRVSAAVFIASLACAGAVSAEMAISANDGKVKLVNGVVQVQKDGKDTISIIDLDAKPPRIVIEIEVPASVVGPPMSAKSSFGPMATLIGGPTTLVGTSISMTILGGLASRSIMLIVSLPSF